MGKTVTRVTVHRARQHVNVDFAMQHMLNLSCELSGYTADNIHAQQVVRISNIRPSAYVRAQLSMMATLAYCISELNTFTPYGLIKQRPAACTSKLIMKRKDAT